MDSDKNKLGKRDWPGPEHKPTVELQHEIEGVVTAISPYVRYGDENVLTEFFRPEWVGVFAKDEAIEHLYTVHAPTGGMRKEWYYHEHVIDRYVILNGFLDVGLYDARPDSKTFGKFEVVNLGESGSGQPNALRIPALVWHSLRWRSDQGLFLCAKVGGYNREVPDKFRVQPEDYPEAIIWNI